MSQPATADPSTLQVPANLRAFVDVLGVDGALEFLLEFGGATFYMAADPKGGSEIARHIGRDLATALMARLRENSVRGYVRIPTAKPWAAMVLRARRMPIGMIARRLHVSDVTVSGWLRPPSTQGELF